MMRIWTPAQAGYTKQLVVTTTRPDMPESPGLVRHYQTTRHGVVARTWVGSDLVEVALRRPRNVGATYQGTVRSVAGGWIGLDPNGVQVAPVMNDYLAAEAPLLRLRTGHRSQGTYRWPRHLLPGAPVGLGRPPRRPARV